MAVTRTDDTDTSKRSNRSINHKLDLLDKRLNSMYKDTYISRPDNKDNINATIGRLDTIIDSLQGSDTNVSGMSELLRRVDNNEKSNSKQLMTSVSSLFNDQNLIGSLFANDDIHNYIAGQNYNYDLICKYLPRLQDALEIKRDNVLCSDNLSKNFINPISNKTSKSEIEKFSNNIKRIEKEYEISDFLDKCYMNTSKYGEEFVYIVPYKVAFERLFKKNSQRVNSSRIGQVTLFESYDGNVIQCIKEGFESSKEFKNFAESQKYKLSDEDKDILTDFPELGGINIHINHENAILAPLKEYTVIKEKTDLDKFKSLSAVYESTFINESDKLNSMFDGIQKQQKKLTNPKNSYSADGLIINTSVDRDPSKLDKEFYGAVLERIPRENILPIYIGKKCLGFYYFEFAEDPNACGFCGGHHTAPMVGNGSKMQYNMTEYQEELAIRYISSRISQTIDVNFINANKDLKEEIYSLLRYNDKFDASRTNDIGVTFIPAEDMIHCYFELDENTHRGISDLQRAVVPAMLYILLYLTDIIGKITRSTDKRIYYVKQNVETNVARTMMNVVQQIKKGNMGMRQIESMNNILNIVGKYNDFIIPMGPSGDPPIQFEVMQGQNIESPTDMMEKMEEAAVNTIIPFEFVNATYQTDFASRFTMSNTRFLKSIFTRQRKTELFFSKIYTKIYNYEFNENNSEIQIVLPPPTYLTSNNNSQLIDNISQMADKIIEADMPNEDDEVKAEWKRLYIRQTLASYIDYDMVERLLDQAKVNIEVNKAPTTEEGSDDVNDMMDDSL